MRSVRAYGYSIPVLERPIVWGRETGRGDAVLVVANEGMVNTEAQRQEAFRELRAMGGRPISGGDGVAYVATQQVVTATGGTLAGTSQGIIPGAVSVALAAGNSVAGYGGFWRVERTIRVTLFGQMTTAGSSPGTFTPDWKVDTSATGTTGNTLGAGPASATLAVSIISGCWCINGLITCQAVGSSGKLWGQAKWQPNTTLLSTQVELFMPNTAPAQATVDTTQNSFIKFLGTLGSASDNMAITMGLWEVAN